MGSGRESRGGRPDRGPPGEVEGPRQCDREAVAGGGFVHYYRDRETLLEDVASGRRQLGFLLEPTRLEQVRDLSDLGQRMPQKSTDFYPKLATGLVMMKMEIEKP